MKTTLVFLFLSVAVSVFARPPQLRPEIVEFYRLRDIALRSRVLAENDFIKKHKAFFKHPLFCEIAFGLEYIHFVEALLIQNERTKAQKYLLKAASLHYVNTSNRLRFMFGKTARTWPDTVYVIPRTPENIKFKETVLEKILEIENVRNVDPRITTIAQELEEMVKIDQAVRSTRGRADLPSVQNVDPRIMAFARKLEDLVKKDPSIHAAKSIIWEHIRKVDSVIILRVIELIKENPDIDIMRIDMLRNRSDIAGFGGSISIILWHQRGNPFAWEYFFLEYFRKRAEKGKGLDYCFWYDTYRSITKPEDTFYGMLPIRNTPFRLSVDNLDKINKNRAKVGLLPLKR